MSTAASRRPRAPAGAALASRPSAPPAQAGRDPAVDVLFVVLPDTLLLDLAGPAEAFRLANQHRARRGLPPAFRLHYVGTEREVASSVGVRLAGLAPLPATLPADAWVVLMGRPGDPSHVVRTTDGWLAARQWLARVVAPALAAASPPTPVPSPAPSPASSRPARRASGPVPDAAVDRRRPHGPHLLTVCAGSLLAADAGLVGTRRVTCHHELLEDLARLAPHAQVCANRVFVQDGPLWSSAGITAGIDLALHAVGAVCGEAVAASVAEVMVVFHRRGADDPERSPLLAGRSHLHPAVHRVQNAVCEDPRRDWGTDALAAVAHVTPRHLARLFREHAGVTPRDYVEQVRHAMAAQAVAQGLPAARAAELAGFSNDRQWRRAQARARRRELAA